MKVNRLVALAAVALLVVGVLGFFSVRAFAENGTISVPFFSESGESGEQDAQGVDNEANEGPETDAANETNQTGDNETGDANESPALVSSIMVDPNLGAGLSDADEAAALAGLATITEGQATTAALDANPGATVVKAQLENENGALVYAVELSTGAEVIVDAGNAAILRTDGAEAGEAGGD